MDTVNTIKDLALKRQTRKRFVFIGSLVVILVSILVSSVDAVAVHSQKNNSSNSTRSPVPELSLKTVCNVTSYPASCISSISKLLMDPLVLFKLSLKVVVDELNSLAPLPSKLAETTNDKSIKSALDVCRENFDLAVYEVNDTVSAVDVVNGTNFLNPAKIDDLQTWLSAAFIDLDTCTDALDETDFGNSTISRDLRSAMVNPTEFTSNSLAILMKILAPLSHV